MCTDAVLNSQAPCQVPAGSALFFEFTTRCLLHGCKTNERRHRVSQLMCSAAGKVITDFFDKLQVGLESASHILQSPSRACEPLTVQQTRRLKPAAGRSRSYLYGLCLIAFSKPPKSVCPEALSHGFASFDYQPAGFQPAWHSTRSQASQFCCVFFATLVDAGHFFEVSWRLFGVYHPTTSPFADNNACNWRVTSHIPPRLHTAACAEVDLVKARFHVPDV